MTAEYSGEAPKPTHFPGRRILGKFAWRHGAEQPTPQREYDDFRIPYRVRGMPVYDAHIIRGPRGLVASRKLLPENYFDLTVVTERTSTPTENQYLRHIFIPYLGDFSDKKSIAPEPLLVIRQPIDPRGHRSLSSVYTSYGREFGQDILDFNKHVGPDKHKLVRIVQLLEATEPSIPEPHSHDQLSIDRVALRSMDDSQIQEAHEISLLVENYSLESLLRSAELADE